MNTIAPMLKAVFPYVLLLAVLILILGWGHACRGRAQDAAEREQVMNAMAAENADFAAEVARLRERQPSVQVVGTARVVTKPAPARVEVKAGAPLVLKLDEVLFSGGTLVGTIAAELESGELVLRSPFTTTVKVPADSSWRWGPWAAGGISTKGSWWVVGGAALSPTVKIPLLGEMRFLGTFGGGDGVAASVGLLW